jgi:hypothetical protein
MRRASWLTELLGPIVLVVVLAVASDLWVSSDDQVKYQNAIVYVALVAVTIGLGHGNRDEVWVCEVATGALRRLTFDVEEAHHIPALQSLLASLGAESRLERLQVREELMATYYEPLKIYYRGTRYRWLGEPAPNEPRLQPKHRRDISQTELDLAEVVGDEDDDARRDHRDQPPQPGRESCRHRRASSKSQEPDDDQRRGKADAEHRAEAPARDWRSRVPGFVARAAAPGGRLSRDRGAAESRL